MKKISLIIVSLLLILFGVISCKTDVELRGPYEDTPIVFGLLDQSVDTQYIKINKSFIGDGNNYAYASIQDCTIYKNVNATITEDNTGNIYELKEKYVKNIEAGIFYADSQKVYYFVPTSPLDETSKYKLNLKINEGLANEKVVTAETEIIKSNFSFDNRSFPEKVEFINLKTNDLKDLSLLFTAPKKEMLFSVKVRFNYIEYLNDNSSSEKYIEFNLGDRTSTYDGAEMEFIFSGQLFFNQISKNTEINNLNNVKKRVVGNFVFYIYAANQELTTYIKLNGASNSIAQERPTYTNIDGGLGLFASRYTIIRDISGAGSKQMKLGPLSLQRLYELGLLFCSDDPTYSTSSSSNGPEDFYCP